VDPNTDFAAHARWRESQRRSRVRRAAAARSRRRRFRGKTLAIAAAVCMTAISGVALAATTAGSSSSSGGTKVVSLTIGSAGPAVKRLQRKLGVPATGYYGSQTKRAVKHFQRAHGLTADGVAGPATLRALGIRVTQASYASGGTSSSQSYSSSSSSVPAQLQQIAQCESGGNPRAISPSGKYRGKYQFDQSTWEAWGGSGDPAAAPESEQDRVAVKLYNARGTSPWPNCA
jgi:peptidoglycan hydrolase-like protein with peptidoglycan-binding domain